MTRRSLIMAGGGLKVAYQAGVLQVWLDEAGLEFDHADGASGGVFNLAMYCQGLSGTEIAGNWRDFPVGEGIDPNWSALFKLVWGESLMEYDRWRANILRRHWALDWDAIRTTSVEATFNAYNFSQHALSVRTPGEMDEDFLIACVSLPMWFPPVSIGGDRYIDAVYITDANLIEAVRRGADELWIVWTVSERAQWNDGFVDNYFQIIETSANGHLRRDLARIEANNAAVARGAGGEFARHVEVKMIRGEVPLHYLINLEPEGFTRAVDQGIREARAWCRANGIALRAGG